MTQLEVFYNVFTSKFTLLTIFEGGARPNGVQTRLEYAPISTEALSDVILVHTQRFFVRLAGSQLDFASQARANDFQSKDFS